MPRTILVSNRLPVQVQLERGQLDVRSSSGGLASALGGVHEDGESLWVGWPGDVSRLDDRQRLALAQRLCAQRIVPVALSAAEIARYYDGFSSGVLWPLCHYLLDTVRVDAARDFATYEVVNRRFADAVAAEWRPGDLVWIHDYQLFLVPAMLRQRIPEARIGFFLHIPFPSSEVLRTLPWRDVILRGMLGADVVGLQTDTYAFHFGYATAQLLGLEPGTDAVKYEDRTVRFGSWPIGIDAAHYEALAREPEVVAAAARLREDAGGRTFVLGVDRLDYTKGVPRRLLAIERLLERSPAARLRMHFTQLAVPTRERVDAYARHRSEVQELVGHIDGQYGTATRAPVHLMHRSVSPRELAALYRAADVMLVTPLRDGMNLVAKEYVASRYDDRGVLVLSELAGAADELQEALLVNPYDLDGVAAAIQRAMQMPLDEQATRMRILRARVRRGDVHAWARRFLEDLAAPDPEATPVVPQAKRPSLTTALADVASQRLLLLLDYDGTLVPIVSQPALGLPDERLRGLLRALAARHEVHILTGRSRDSITAMLGDLPIGLHAEHGLWSRRNGEWHPEAAVDLSWRPAVLALLTELSRRTHASTLEAKDACVTWHYRGVEPQLARARLSELRNRLSRLPEHDRFEVMSGRKALEIRPLGANKGILAQKLAARFPPGAIVAAGDDTTDEQTFAALPPEAITIRVGARRSAARFHVDEVRGLRTALEQLAQLEQEAA